LKNLFKEWSIWEEVGFIVLGVLPIFFLSLWMWSFLSSDDFVGVTLCSIAIAGWMAIVLALHEARKE
jgi:predicted ABC-type sugar transport system permease subunit